jgi:hypothetical protein
LLGEKIILLKNGMNSKRELSFGIKIGSSLYFQVAQKFTSSYGESLNAIITL